MGQGGEGWVGYGVEMLVLYDNGFGNAVCIVPSPAVLVYSPFWT